MSPQLPACLLCGLFLVLPTYAAVVQPDPPLPTFGSWKVQAAYKKWLEVWRSKYVAANGTVPEMSDDSLPEAMRKAEPKVIMSEGGAAGGVVTEGMGYALLVEGMQAASGDATGIENGLSLARSWLGMVRGPGKVLVGGGNGGKASATEVDTYPYGVSAIESLQDGLAASGVATWKYPVDLCKGGCQGSAADADSDAIMGLIYLCAALKYPADFVDVVLRAVVTFASADLGFPDLYRVLPDGSKVFVPKGGSDWGGVLPSKGKFESSQHSWCYSPGYFAPAQYRIMRAFAVNNWRSDFDHYLPPHLSGKKTTLDELAEAFDGAVSAGYNILYYSSCASGSASNWVGVKAECENKADLSCEGVPWATTPYVGEEGECTASGTSFGAYGAEASRTPWRIALDFAIYPEWATKVQIYNRQGEVDKDTTFNAQTYLNRFANQYKKLAQPVSDPSKLCPAFDVSHGATDLTCAGVPHNGTANWWASLMAYPTFVGFIAPLASGSKWESQQWMDALVGLCDTDLMKGMFCDTSYFGSSMEVIATMILAGAVKKGGPPPPPPRTAEKVISDAALEDSKGDLIADSPTLRRQRNQRTRDSYQTLLFPLLGLSAALSVPLATVAAYRRRLRPAYSTLEEGRRGGAAAAPA